MARLSESSASYASALLSISRFVHFARLTRTPRKLPHQVWVQRSRARPSCSQILYSPTSASRLLVCDISQRCFHVRLRASVIRAARVPFQPFVDPLRLESDRSSSTHARVAKRSPLARRVDRVPADAGVFCGLGNLQPCLHTPSARTRQSRRVRKTLSVELRAQRADQSRRAVVFARMRA